MPKSRTRRKPTPIKRGDGVGGVTMRAVRGPDDEGRWYWRIDTYVGAGVREGLGSGWFSVADAKVEGSRVHGDLEARRAAREAEAADAERKQAEQGRTIADLMAAWTETMAAEAKESIDRPVQPGEAAGHGLRLRRKTARTSAAGDSTRATRGIRAERTVVVNRRTAEAITRLIGSRPVSDANGAAEALEAEYLRQVVGKPAVTTLHLYQSTLRRAYVWARANRLVREVPQIVGYEFDPVLDTKREKWTPNREELARLLQATRDVAGPRRRWAVPVVSLLAGTGLRVGEAAGLRVGDFDLDSRTVTVRRKGQSLVTIALSVGVVAAIRPLIDGRPPDELLVPARGDSTSGVPLLSNRVAALLRQAAEHAEIPHRVTAHSLRRYASTELFSASDGEYRDLMGHRKEVAADTYRAARLEKQREVLEAAKLLPDLAAET